MSDDESTSDLDPDCLYEDKYSRLTKKEITLYTYFFPTFQSKIIEVMDIQRVYYKKQQLCGDCFRAKDWGMSLSPIWWACDIGRSCRGGGSDCYNVVIDTGSSIKKGFTVVDIHNFLEQLKLLVDPSKFIANDLPACCGETKRD